jgi:hypothetical protein
MPPATSGWSNGSSLATASPCIIRRRSVRPGRRRPRKPEKLP